MMRFIKSFAAMFVDGAADTFPRSRPWFVSGGAIALALCLLASAPVRAVDPLPEDLENAAPEVQDRYLERMGRESHQKKLQAGYDRYQRRLRTKQVIHHQLATQVANRRAQMQDAASILGNRLQGTSLLVTVFVVFICAIFLGLGLRIVFHFSRR